MNTGTARRQIVLKREYVYNRTMPVKNPDGTESHKTMKLKTPHDETHLMCAIAIPTPSHAHAALAPGILSARMPAKSQGGGRSPVRRCVENAIAKVRQNAGKCHTREVRHDAYDLEKSQRVCSNFQHLSLATRSGDAEKGTTRHGGDDDTKSEPSDQMRACCA